LEDNLQGNDSDNRIIGAVGNVVQARSIIGDVHVHQSIRRVLVPRQLPADINSFTGRAAALDTLDGLLSQTGGSTSNVVLTPVIAGSPGVGKTALAVHWAHRVAPQFPDGQLYVNLRGYDPIYSPMSSQDILWQILLVMDVPAEKIPTDIDARTVLYRSLVAGKKMLVLLDNARSSDQVRPLLPGSPSSMVVTVVSRSCCEFEDGEWSVGSAAGPSGGFGDVGTSGQVQCPDREVAEGGHDSRSGTGAYGRVVFAVEGVT
jgi:hypothetical protein